MAENVTSHPSSRRFMFQKKARRRAASKLKLVHEATHQLVTPNVICVETKFGTFPVPRYRSKLGSDIVITVEQPNMQYLAEQSALKQQNLHSVCITRSFSNDRDAHVRFYREEELPG